MIRKSSFSARVWAIWEFCGLFAVALVAVNQPVEASWVWPARPGHHAGDGPFCPVPGGVHDELESGTWYWMRSPEQEKRVIMSLYSRYCIRCHGVDGHGVWDIPDVPDFTNGRWQVSRSDAQLVRGTLEGRGACMPAFRGTLTLEEVWAMARYLRTFMPGSEMPRPEKALEEGPAFMPAMPKVLQTNPSTLLQMPRRVDNVVLPVIPTNP